MHAQTLTIHIQLHSVHQLLYGFAFMYEDSDSAEYMPSKSNLEKLVFYSLIYYTRSVMTNKPCALQLY